jgi:hypothetical protein
LHPTAPGAAAHSGKLRIEFVDGTVQEIEMGLVRRLTWEK